MPLVALTVFVVVDLLANWKLVPGRTVSEWVWDLGWRGRIAVALFTCMVLAHLFIKRPYGPPS